MSDNEDDAMNGADYEEEESDSECDACGEELDEHDQCGNENCDEFDDHLTEPMTYVMSDYEERQWERKQMGITS